MAEQIQETQAHGKAEEEDLNLGIMKSGDYMIHVYLQKGKNFKLEDSPDDSEDEDKLFNAIAVVQCGSTKFYSKTLSDCKVNSDDGHYWGEHFFFEPKGLHSDEIQSTSLQIRIMDKCFFKDKTIGVFDIDLSSIYFMNEEHAMQHQWVAINNPEGKDFNSIKGYLQISVAVQGPSDSSVKLTDPEGVPSEEMDNQQIMMPSSIRKQYKQIRLSIVQAQKLPKYDTMFGTIDAYIKCEFNKVKYKTKVVTQKNDVCNFNQTFLFPVQWPPTQDALVLKVWDEDKVNDEIVCTIKYSLRQIVKHYSKPGGVMVWQNLYGGPLGMIDGPNKNLMNANPDFASLWKGRFLMHFEVEDAKAPQASIESMGQQKEDYFRQSGIFTNNHFEIMAEVGVGVRLPDKKSYKIKIQIADFELESSKPKESKSGYCRWSERFKPQSFSCPYRTIDELDRVYVYLMDGDTPICYWRGRAADFADPNPEYKWLPLTNDLAVGKVKKAYKAGLIQIKLSINDKQENPNLIWDQFESWSKLPPKRLSAKLIRCYIFQCKDLPSADSDGTSDPFIKIFNPEGKSVKTKVVKDNLNPIFFETLEMQYDMGNLETAPPIILDLFDHDSGMMDITDDFLGRAVVHLDDESVKDLTRADQATMNKPPTPKWHDIRVGFDKSLPVTGQVLCSFALVEYDAHFAQKAEDVRLSQQVRTKIFNIDIHVLGLRQLQSFGILPIKKAFMKFNVRSLLPQEKAHAVTNIQTEPKCPGPNPNINTTISFSAELPFESLYCPKLQCDVFDQICKGLSQPLIGSFTISIGEIMAEEYEFREQFLQQADKEIKALQRIMDNTQYDPEAVQQLKEERESKELEKRRNSQPFDAIVQPQPVKKQPKQQDQIFKMREQILSDLGSLKRGDTAHHQLQEDDDDDFDDDNQINMVTGRSDMAEPDDVMFTVLEPPDVKSKVRFNKSQSILDELLQKSQEDLEIEQADSEQKNLKQLFKKVTLKSDVGAQREFKEELARLKKRREEQALLEGLVRLKTRNKILEKKEQKLLEEMQVLSKEIKEAKRTKLKEDVHQHSQKMAQAGFDVSKNVIFPTYERDQRLNIFREVSVPPSQLFYSLGYAGVLTDQKPPSDGQKHYRKVYQDELENNKEIFNKQPFEIIPIIRGQNRGLSKSFLDSLFSGPRLDDSGCKSTLKDVGSFKGYITVKNEEETEEFEQASMQRTKQIQTLITQIYSKKYGEESQINLKDVEASEKKSQIRDTLLKINAYSQSLMKFIVESNYDRILESQLSSQQTCLVRLYLLEGFDFSSRDLGSFSDPYIVVKCGQTKFNRRDKYQVDEPNPKFYEVFEINSKFPGSSPLEIEAYDFDDLFGDDLIGKTVIDLDDRFFSQEWKAIKDKPIEYRELYHPSTTLAQGTVLCWVDIFQQNSKKGGDNQTQWNINPEPIRDYQLRLSVYGTQNVPTLDVEGTSDVFIRAWIDENNKKETDTHWRCQGGDASFNYRLLYDFKSPSYTKADSEAYKLKLQVMDRDVFKANDLICEFTLDLRLLVVDCRSTQKPIHLSKKYYSSYLRDAYYADSNKSNKKLSLEFEDEDSFWLSIKRPDDPKPIKIRLDLRVFPGLDAQNQKVGEARLEPNHSPALAKPEGRIQFTANPMKMLEQLIGPELRKKIYANLFLIICVVLLIFMAPMILSNISAKLILGIFGLN